MLIGQHEGSWTSLAQQFVKLSGRQENLAEEQDGTYPLATCLAILWQRERFITHLKQIGGTQSGCVYKRSAPPIKKYPPPECALSVRSGGGIFLLSRKIQIVTICLLYYFGFVIYCA